MPKSLFLVPSIHQCIQHWVFIVTSKDQSVLNVEISVAVSVAMETVVSAPGAGRNARGCGCWLADRSDFEIPVPDCSQGSSVLKKKHILTLIQIHKANLFPNRFLKANVYGGSSKFTSAHWRRGHGGRADLSVRSPAWHRRLHLHVAALWRTWWQARQIFDGGVWVLTVQRAAAHCHTWIFQICKHNRC